MDSAPPEWKVETDERLSARARRRGAVAGLVAIFSSDLDFSLISALADSILGVASGLGLGLTLFAWSTFSCTFAI